MKKRESGCTMVFAITLMLAGGALCAASAWTALQVVVARSWTSAEGTVEFVAPDTLTYRFSVGNTVYRGNRNGIGLIGEDPPWPKKGDIVTVWFDPERPEKCALTNSADPGGMIGACVGGILVLFLPGLFFYLLIKKSSKKPPPKAALLPSPGSAVYKPANAEVAPGRVGRTRLRVATWKPGETILIKQRRTWKFYPIGIVLALAVCVFVAMYINNPGNLSWEKFWPDALRWCFVIFPFMLLSWPDPPGSVTFDWPEDAIRIKSGLRRRILGLHRIRAVQLSEKTTGGGIQPGSKTYYYYELIAWIKPDTGETAPFLLASTRKRGLGGLRDSDVEALKQLARAIASQLDVGVGGSNQTEPFE